MGIKLINLISLLESDVQYTITKFPDGEIQFSFDYELDRKDKYHVKCRITNAEELFTLLQVGDILDRQEIIWDLEINYLMGMRMDRVMSFDRPFTLKIVGNLISNMNYRTCFITEPHSERTSNEIRKSCDINGYVIPFINKYIHDDITIVFPDLGALQRYYDNIYFDKCGIDNVVYFEKYRNKLTGKIEAFSLKNEDKINNNHFLFYDDLCDAGGTFLGELSILKRRYPDGKFDIRVAHLVNEEGLDNLCKNFDTVYVTNSYKNWEEVAKRKGYNNLIIFDINNE
jgi:ribose-phosphate pyrophosphokinase